MKLFENVRKFRLPYLVIGLGLSITFSFSYTLWDDIQDYVEVLRAVQHHLPWITFLIGASISLLLGYVTLSTQIARQRAITLAKINIELKREISERENAEDTQQKLEIALLQGQKLQAMGTLAGGIAHDFNNILYAIIGYVEMAREDVAKDSLIYINLGKVIEACHRGQELVARILAFSRRQHHTFEAIDLTHNIEAALSLLRPTIPASVMIEFESKIDVYILGNQTQLHQVFVNLINNAVDAMDGEGTIVIKLSHIPATDPLLRQFPETRAHDKDYCKIEITDTGHGMDQQTMDRIFEPFYTTKEVGKGTGLGLSIVHSVIKEHQGEITVRSQLGQGTTFMILLPECKDKPIG